MVDTCLEIFDRISIDPVVVFSVYVLRNKNQKLFFAQI